jgi:hypothetical protein
MVGRLVQQQHICLFHYELCKAHTGLLTAGEVGESAGAHIGGNIQTRSDLVEVGPEHVTPYLLWELPADSLARHPYIRSYETARAIVLYRDNNPPENCTVEGLAEAGIISSDAARQLSRCFIKIRETGD